MPMKLPTRDQLVKRRAIVTADGQMKLECGDHHGCADAMMDLREIEAMIGLLDAQAVEPHGNCANGAHLIQWDVTMDEFQCRSCGWWFKIGRTVNA